MRRFSILTLLLSACFHAELADCTEIGCVDGLEVFFVGTDPGPGVYTVEIDLHGEFIHCQATIPLGTDGDDGCTDARVSLFLSGSALEADQQSVDGFFLDSTDTGAVAVTISHDAVQVGYAAFEPDYQTLQPNGPECEPTCSYATREIELDG
jgi:hypothetical protein